MEFQLLLIIALFSVLFAESHVALSPQAYWNSVLPNTEMPKAITDLLKPADTTIETTMGVGMTDTVTQLRDSKTQEIFFLEKDLKLGKSMILEFTKNDGDTNFLARSDADKIPFLSEKMSDVYSLYDVKPGSEEGKMMMQTVSECEKPANKGEEKYCATSLESMVDFSTSKLGKHLCAISTEVEKETKLQKYTIMGLSKKGNKPVVCHKESYPYAIFYCHDTQNTEAYTISLVGTDRTKAKAVVICHTDPSTWKSRRPITLPKQWLSMPICHALPEGEIVWVAN